MSWKEYPAKRLGVDDEDAPEEVAYVPAESDSAKLTFKDLAAL